jgi:hypothetical protein
MKRDGELHLQRLRAAGWRVERFSDDAQHPLPNEIIHRYPWMPPEFREFAEQTKIAMSADERAWLLTAHDFASESASAWTWNEWERQSLDAADGDVSWQQSIRTFWDDHLPILMSVKSGYAYFAIKRTTLGVVQGEEPEYEETSPVATSFAEFLALLAARDSKFDPWV